MMIPAFFHTRPPSCWRPAICPVLWQAVMRQSDRPGTKLGGGAGQAIQNLARPAVPTRPPTSLSPVTSAVEQHEAPGIRRTKDLPQVPQKVCHTRWLEDLGEVVGHQ